MTPEGSPLVVRFSPLETVAKLLGILDVCSQVERAPVTEATEPTRALTMRVFVELMSIMDVDAYLKDWAPEEELFKRTIGERTALDPLCFTTTYNRVLEIRAERGVLIRPLQPVPKPENKGKTAHFSSLENYSRILGIVGVLSMTEQYFQQGALSEGTYDGLITNLIRVAELDRKLDVFFPEAKLAPLKTRLRTESDCMRTTYQHMIDCHEELFPTLALGFVDQFLDKYITAQPKQEVRAILYTLQQRLIARREAVESLRYDRLEAIDKNSEHLLSTLKQYGIDAASYEEARQAYAIRFAPPVPPTNVRDEVRQRIREAVRSKVDLQEDCMAEVRLNPQWEEFIRWEYQAEIDKLKGDA